MRTTPRRGVSLLAASVLALGMTTAACEDDDTGIDDVEQDVEDVVDDAVDDVEDGVDSAVDEVEDGVDEVVDEVDGDPDDGSAED